MKEKRRKILAMKNANDKSPYDRALLEIIEFISGDVVTASSPFDQDSDMDDAWT